MIGAAPVDELLAIPGAETKAPADEAPAKGEKSESEPEAGKEGTPKPMLATTAPVPITPEDYELYTKEGHRSEAWDEWIKPGFESFDQGNYATAAIFLKSAYEKGCRDPMVLFRLGIYKESRGETKEAADLLQQASAEAAKRYPGHPLSKAIHRHAGRALYKIDKFAEAKPHLQEALRYEPDDFMLLLMSGQIERMEGRKKEARALFEKALAAKMPEGVEPNPKTTVFDELIILTYDLKDLDACEKYIEEALKHDPKDKVAAKYKALVGRARFRQRELEIIKKITE